MGQGSSIGGKPGSKLLHASLGTGLAQGDLQPLGGEGDLLAQLQRVYDTFGVGHSSTSISAAAGMAAAARLKNEKRRVVAVIGDGGMTAGMAFEALNHAGHLKLDMLVIYNDNDMSISENVGALRDVVARQLGRSHPATGPGSDIGTLAGLVAALGFQYSGPVDGHALEALLPALETLMLNCDFPDYTGRTNRTLAAAGATHLAVDLVGGGFAALLPTITERLALSSTGAGVLVALFSVSAAWSANRSRSTRISWAA